MKRQAQLFYNVEKNIVSNLDYLNQSVRDTVGSLISRSVVSYRGNYHLYVYCRWDAGED